MGKRLASSTTRWTWAAATLALLAAGFFAWQVVEPGRTSSPRNQPSAIAVQPADDEPAAEAEESFALKPAADYSEVIDRPLFVRSRRPVAVASADTARGRLGSETIPASNLALTGIVLTGKRRVALLRVDNEPRMMHVAEGQMAGGWKIETIAANKVVVRRGDTANTLVLDYKKSGPVPVANTPRDGYELGPDAGPDGGPDAGPDAGLQAGGNAPDKWEEGAPVDVDEGVVEEDQPSN